MIKRKDKKGLSEVVTNLILILLVVVAVSAVWVVVRGLISRGAEDIESGLITFDLQIQNAYISGSNVIVSVKRNAGGGELVGIKFIFFNGIESISVDKIDSLTELGRKSFTFTPGEIPGIGTGDEVSVAPLYESGGQKTGRVTDTATISGTGPGGGGGGAICGNGQCEAGENSLNCPADCPGGTICGDGICDLSENSITCPADCIGPGGTICGDGTCDPSEDPVTCPADCTVPSSCNGVWDQTDIDDGNECDGDPLPNNCQTTCVCETGFGPNGFGGCTLDPPLDTGIILSLWHNLYFDSENLPKSTAVTDYIGEHVNFINSSEVGCFLITFADYITEDDISYLRVDDTLGAPNINPGQGYSVWEAENCGQ